MSSNNSVSSKTEDLVSSADIPFEYDDDIFGIGLDINELENNDELGDTPDVYLDDIEENESEVNVLGIDLAELEQFEIFNKKYEIWLTSLINSSNMSEAEKQMEDFCKQSGTTIPARFGKTVETVRDDFYETLASECREKIKIMTTCKNSFKQKVLKNDIIEFIRKFIPDKDESRMVFTIYSAELEKAEIYNLEQLREIAEKMEIKFLVKDYMPVGKLLLWTGAPKTGKTMIGSHLAVCVAQGKPFFNRETTQGNVLVIQNEEYIADITRKRFEAGIVDLQISNPQLYKELISEKRLLVARGLDLALDREQIIDIVKENNISLVVVDSLGKSITNAGLTEQSPEVTTVLYAIQTACFENNFSMVILHHATKGGQDKETKSRTIDRVAGVNGITRPPDALWFLEPSKKEKHNNDGAENQVDIKIIPRFGKSSSLTVERIEEEARFWSYVVVEESLLSEEEVKDICLIVKALLQVYEPWSLLESEEKTYPIPGMSLKQLVKITKIEHARLIKRLNYVLDDLGHYVANGIRVYHIPSEGTCLEEYVLNEKVEQLKIEKQKASKLLEQQMMKSMSECTTLAELKELTKDWKQEEKSKIWNLLSEENRQHLHLFINPPKFSNGDIVTVNDSSENFLIVRCYYNEDNKYHQYYLKDSENNDLNSPFLEADLLLLNVDGVITNVESPEINEERDEHQQ